MRVLVAGATGYIGSRLVPRLLAEGHVVRCLARDPRKLRDVPWAEDVQIVQGDVQDENSLREAMAGLELLYYLVHSLNSSAFADLDRRAAGVVARAGHEAGVRRIVYLGGLHPPDESQLSAHLASRAEVGGIFLRSSVPSIVLQASVIIGSGSASFEMLRYLTERLPVSVTPRWVHTRTQPIAVRDVLNTLIACATFPDGVNRTFDIGGPEVLTYADMMRRYARCAGLGRRTVVPVPLLTPRLSAHWVNLVTPVPRSIATPLIDSLVHEAVCRENDITEYLPSDAGEPIPYDRAVRLALERIRDAEVESRWSKASTVDAPSDPLATDPAWAGGSVQTDRRELRTQVPAVHLWRIVESIGGENGWYSFPLAWAVRGWADRLAGGVGLRRGRRDPERLHLGDALDWWRVEEIDRGRLLRLRAEMKVPGRAWLEMSVTPHGNGSVYRQRAIFVPRGLAGQVYWWALWPFHGVIFGGMARNIVRTAGRGRNPDPCSASERQPESEEGGDEGRSAGRER